MTSSPDSPNGSPIQLDTLLSLLGGGLRELLDTLDQVDLQVLREMLDTLDQVDIEALSDWIATGTSLFPRDGLPPLRAVFDGAREMLVTRAYQRHDRNITRAAQTLGLSRRTFRAQLRRSGLYEGSESRSDATDRGQDAHRDAATRTPDDREVDAPESEFEHAVPWSAVPGEDDDEDTQPHPIRVNDEVDGDG